MIERQFKKIDDKYSYEDVNFPAGYDDVETFEQNNHVSVFVYAIIDDTIFREKCRNQDYVSNDVVYLLRRVPPDSSGPQDSLGRNNEECLHQ